MKRSLGEIFRKGYQSFSNWRKYANSRQIARKYRKMIVEHKGSSSVTPKMIAAMKSEMKERFGDAGHWPWIALYTELRGEYITGWMPNDYYAYEVIPAVNPIKISGLSTFKSFDHRIFRGYTIEPIVIWVKRSFYSTTGQLLPNNEAMKRINDFNGEVVIKRDESPSGKGIVFKDSASVTLDDFSPDSTGLVQPSVQQHQELSRIYDQSVNTIRILTVLKENGNVDVKYILFRVGAEGRRIVNAKDSELCMYVNDSGDVISDAVNYIGLSRGDRHPDTGIRYRDFHIPSIPEAKSLCCEAHKLFPYLKIIGWDLFIDRNNSPKIIEWNARQPEMWVNEALIGPLWTEDFS